MRPYEVVVIFESSTDAQLIQTELDRFLEVIRSNDGTVGAIDRWGRRPFTYEVNHKREGYYVLVGFAGTPATVAELDRQLGLADVVLRHKIIRLPEKHAAAIAAAK